MRPPSAIPPTQRPAHGPAQGPAQGPTQRAANSPPRGSAAPRDAASAGLGAGNAAGHAVAVVIPYFQRRPGLLARALASVFAQRDAGEVEAVVVDDGSPLPARGELAGLPAADRDRVRLIEAANGGPAVARNRALDVLEERHGLVAFLDSDDWWEPEHLARARAALSADFDLYVSNWMPLESDRDAYNHFEKVRPEEHDPLDLAPELFAYRGDFFLQELTRPIGRLSTLVMRRAPFADLRFEPRLTCAFEDRLFRLELARRGVRLAFSTRPEVRSGEGVNIFSSSGWGTRGRLDTARDELLALRLVKRRFALDGAQRAAISGLARRERRDALGTFVRLALRERRLELRRLARLFAADPAFPLLAPWALFGPERSSRA